ncbi:MAG: DUF2267 domain-containing protein [Cyclobacteriaceae bacterium]
MNLDKAHNDGKHFMHLLQQRLGTEDNWDKTTRILKGILHTLRDNMQVGEAINALAQMPLFLKGIFVDEWKYSAEPEKLRSLNKYVEAVQNRKEIVEFKDLPDEEAVIHASKEVISLLSEYLSEGQMEHIKSNMHKDLHFIFDEALSHH